MKFKLWMLFFHFLCFPSLWNLLIMYFWPETFWLVQKMFDNRFECLINTAIFGFSWDWYTTINTSTNRNDYHLAYNFLEISELLSYMQYLFWYWAIDKFLLSLIMGQMDGQYATCAKVVWNYSIHLKLKQMQKENQKDWNSTTN